jgi:hypothetical protein
MLAGCSLACNGADSQRQMGRQRRAGWHGRQGQEKCRDQRSGQRRCLCLRARRHVDLSAPDAALAGVDGAGAARVSNAPRGLLKLFELAIDLTQKHRATLARHAAVIESAFLDASAKTVELDGPHINFFGTVWLGTPRSLVALEHHDQQAFRGECRHGFYQLRETSGLARTTNPSFS